VKTYFY